MDPFETTAISSVKELRGRESAPSDGRYKRLVFTVKCALALSYIPKMGRFIPNMGTTPRVGLASALFPGVQGRVLSLIFGQPDREYQSAELIRLVGSGTGAAHRELARLESAGLVQASHRGHQKYYQANRQSPVFAELQALIQKTSGIAEPIRAALAPYESRIQEAFVYGSVAKGNDSASSDIDVMIISDSLEYADVFEALQRAELLLGRPINPTLLSRSRWRRRKDRLDSFAGRVARQPKLMLFGGSESGRA